jgi:hypothetical protein
MKQYSTTLFYTTVSKSRQQSRCIDQTGNLNKGNPEQYIIHDLFFQRNKDTISQSTVIIHRDIWGGTLKAREILKIRKKSMITMVKQTKGEQLNSHVRIIQSMIALHFEVLVKQFCSHISHTNLSKAVLSKAFSVFVFSIFPAPALTFMPFWIFHILSPLGILG